MISLSGSLPEKLTHKMQKNQVSSDQLEAFINNDSKSLRGKNRVKLQKLADLFFKESMTFSIYFERKW